VYEVPALIGTGGMGEVYRARDTRLSRDVAIKVLRTISFDGDTALYGGLAEHGYQFVCRIPQGGRVPTGLPSTSISARAAPAVSGG
jgi:hypothetical protein